MIDPYCIQIKEDDMKCIEIKLKLEVDDKQIVSGSRDGAALIRK